MDAIFVVFPPILGIAVVTAELARSKGYKGRWWFLIGFVLPLFSLFILFVLPNIKQVTPNINSENTPTHNDKVLYQKHG